MILFLGACGAARSALVTRPGPRLSIRAHVERASVVDVSVVVDGDRRVAARTCISRWFRRSCDVPHWYVGPRRYRVEVRSPRGGTAIIEHEVTGGEAEVAVSSWFHDGEEPVGRSRAVWPAEPGVEIEARAGPSRGGHQPLSIRNGSERPIVVTSQGGAFGAIVRIESDGTWTEIVRHETMCATGLGPVTIEPGHVHRLDAGWPWPARWTVGLYAYTTTYADADGLDRVVVAPFEVR